MKQAKRKIALERMYV